MTHNWKPGDIALVEAGCWANRIVALRSGVPSNMGWAYCGEESSNKWSSDASGIVTPIRPLLVIDPEDRAQIERLAVSICAEYGDARCEPEEVELLQAALRALLEPEPKEPTGLGAVVQDSEGVDWHRTRDGRWIAADGLRTLGGGWGHLPRPLTVLAPGYVGESSDD